MNLLKSPRFDRKYLANRDCECCECGEEDNEIDLAQVIRQASVGFPLSSKWAAKMPAAGVVATRAAWLKGFLGDAQGYANHEMSDFLRVRTSTGEVLDFHALRHTCGAWLAIRGVAPKVIQSVMRHSTIKLTLDTYGHLIDGAESKAVEQGAMMFEQAKLTGTDGLPAGKLDHYLITNRVRGGCETVLEGAKQEPDVEGVEKRKKPGNCLENSGFFKAEDKGFEQPLKNLGNSQIPKQVAQNPAQSANFPNSPNSAVASWKPSKSLHWNSS